MAKDKLDADLAVVREYIARWCRDDAAVRYAMDDLAAGVALLRIKVQRAQDNAEELALGTERLTRENRRLNDEALTMTRQFDGVTQERDRALALVQALLPVAQTVASIKEWAGDRMAPYDARISLLTIMQARKALQQYEGGATE